MGTVKVLVFLVISLFILSCSAGVVVPPSSSFNRGGSSVIAQDSYVPPIIVPKKKDVKVYDPLDGKFLNFSAAAVPVSTVLYTISVDTGLNLVISPDVFGNAENDDSQTITANFVKTPVKDALDIIMELGNIFCEVKGNILFVKKYNTNVYSIPYLSVSSNYNAGLGGDVVGGADQEGNSNLQGDFTLQYERSADAVDFYGQLEQNLDSLLGADQDSFFQINKMTGIVSITTTYNSMQNVEKLLTSIVDTSVRQVLIEARILEVILNSKSAYGIDWSKFLGSTNGIKFSSPDLPAGTGNDFFGAMFGISLNRSLQGTLRALADYGNIETLANPRITVMNGQNAMISAGSITPYWDRKVTKERNDDGSTGGVDVSFERYSVLNGVTLGITPYIHEDDTVMLNIIPITTEVESTKYEKDGDTVVASGPIINVKEAGTTVLMENNSILVIGGIISNDKSVRTTTVPILGSIPVIGYLFSLEVTSYNKKELVILLKPTVVDIKPKVIKK